MDMEYVGQRFSNMDSHAPATRFKRRLDNQPPMGTPETVFTHKLPSQKIRKVRYAETQLTMDFVATTTLSPKAFFNVLVTPTIKRT